MAVNPAGFVPVFDFGQPKIVTGKAKADISGGQFLIASGAQDIVSSGINSYATSDLEFTTGGSGVNFGGVALQNASSGANVSVAIEGVILARCGSTVNASAPVMVLGADAVHTLGSQVVPQQEDDPAAAGMKVGRALAAGGSNAYTLVYFQI